MAPQPFEVETKVLEGPIHLVSVSGELDLGTVPQLEDSLAVARGAEGISLLIDLSDCEFIDSSGFSLLISSWRDLEGKEGGERLVLCCPRDQVKRLLEITGIEGSISVHDDLEDALRELRGKGETARPA